METNVPKGQTDELVSVEERGASDEHEHEGQELHAATIADTTPVTPARFYARLRNQLQMRGIDYDALPRLTPEGDTPRCFTYFQVPFDRWLSSASLLGATVPYRFDMPAEPNYCFDCQLKTKKEAIKAGVCNFPGVRFERLLTTIRGGERKIVETEIVGVSRNVEYVISEADLRRLLPGEGP